MTECETCQHYKIKENYCNLMDELVQPQDNCGLYNKGDHKK